MTLFSTKFEWSQLASSQASLRATSFKLVFSLSTNPAGISHGKAMFLATKTAGPKLLN